MFCFKIWGTVYTNVYKLIFGDFLGGAGTDFCLHGAGEKWLSSATLEPANLFSEPEPINISLVSKYLLNRTNMIFIHKIRIINSS